MCSRYFNALLGNVIPNNTLVISIAFTLLAPLGLFRGPFTLFGCGAATLGILKGIGFSTPYLYALMVIPSITMNVSICMTQSWIAWGGKLCKSFNKGTSEEDIAGCMDYLCSDAGSYIYHVWLKERAKMSNRKVRMGIDVGGTHTKAVAIDNATHQIIGKSSVKTSHDDKAGVAAGVVQAFQNCLRENRIDPKDVIFVAHSTTQATNALIEGDVAHVGVVGVETERCGRMACEIADKYERYQSWLWKIDSSA